MLVGISFIAPTIYAVAASNLQSLFMAKVENRILAVTAVNDQDGRRVHGQTQRHSQVSNIVTKTTKPVGGTVTKSAIAVSSVNNHDGTLIDYYTQYNGNGSTADGWPSKDRWISFMDMCVQYIYLLSLITSY